MKFSSNKRKQQKKMSAQVAPFASLDGGGTNTNGSTTTTSGSTTTHTTPSNKHICSRFLKKRPPDLYGQRHAIESAKCLSDSLRLLEKEIGKLSEETRSGLDQAKVICPEISESKEHRLMFLRCEQFNTDVSNDDNMVPYILPSCKQFLYLVLRWYTQLAALRMANYWNTRIQLFGSKAFAPFSIADILEKDRKELSLGFLRLIPETDGTGRCNIFMDPSVLEGHEYKDENMCRAAWYILHAALENNESTQQKGIVFLVYLRYTYVRHFDRSLVKLIANSIKGVLPVRVSAIHIFHAPYLFEVLFDVVSLLLGERLTKRMKMYSGEDEVIHDQLGDYGILPSRLPSELGGSLDLDQDAWIAERERSEEGK